MWIKTLSCLLIVTMFLISGCIVAPAPPRYHRHVVVRPVHPPAFVVRPRPTVIVVPR